MAHGSEPNDDYRSFSDEELLCLYRRNRNADVIGLLFKRYSHLVFGVCLHYLYDRNKAEDAVMGIYEKLFDALHRHKVHNFKAWICTVSKNHCLMELRKSFEKRIVLFDDPKQFDMRIMENEHATHLNDNVVDEQIENLLTFVAALKPIQQKCIRLFYLDSFSYEEIAEQAGVSKHEVKSHIQNGKRNLKLFMEGKKKI